VLAVSSPANRWSGLARRRRGICVRLIRWRVAIARARCAGRWWAHAVQRVAVCFWRWCIGCKRCFMLYVRRNFAEHCFHVCNEYGVHHQHLGTLVGGVFCQADPSQRRSLPTLLRGKGHPTWRMTTTGTTEYPPPMKSSKPKKSWESCNEKCICRRDDQACRH